MKRILSGAVGIVVLVNFWIAALLAAEKLDDRTWQVGVSGIEITPKDSMWMAGYAARDHGAEGTLHPLWAKALVLQDANGNRGVIVTTDLLGFPRNMSDTIKSQSLDKYGLTKAQIILSSSHTHSGPVLRNSLYDVYPLSTEHIAKIETYSANLETRIVDLIGEALNNVQSVNLLAANGVVRFQINRRNNNSSTLSSQADLNGPNDYAVPVLWALSPDSAIPAVLFGYACHATVLNGYLWSGDYPGFAQIELEKNFPGTTALFFQGGGADQNPLPRRTTGLAQQYGKELAAAVENVLSSPADTLLSQLKMEYQEIDLDFATPPETAALRKIAEKENGYQQRWAKRLLSRLANSEKLETFYPYPVQVWRIGDQPLFVLGGEVVIDYAIQLKRIFGEKAFVMGYANDVMAYIPSVRVLREGGYEGAEAQIVYGLPAAWEATIENRIISACIRLAGKIGVKMPEEQLLGP